MAAGSKVYSMLRVGSMGSMGSMPSTAREDCAEKVGHILTQGRSVRAVQAVLVRLVRLGWLTHRRTRTATDELISMLWLGALVVWMLSTVSRSTLSNDIRCGRNPPSTLRAHHASLEADVMVPPPVI